MVSTTTVFSIVIGAAIARFSARFPARVEIVETIAGILIVSGFAAIGCALPVMV
jgi:uncharacterized membrane protein YphA (DoxX/SURF4 family)